jgi:gluconate 2-dehydrogenase
MLSHKLRVLVTRAVFPSVIERLSQHFDVESNPDDVLWDREELLRRVEGKDGLFAFGTERIDAELLSRSPSLKIAANMTVGYNNFDLPAMSHARVLGTNAGDVLTETTVPPPLHVCAYLQCMPHVLLCDQINLACYQADFGFALLMATARRVTESEHFLRAGLWTRWRYDMCDSSF